MKSLLTLLISLVTLTMCMAQTIRRVNNNPGISGTNVYSTFVAAHTAAAANDIIIVEPSSASYGDVTITKPLKIYGNGYFLTTNTELKADQRTATLGTISFNTGSGGSEMYGIAAGTIYIYGVSNMIISRNYFSGMTIFSNNLASTTNTNITNIFISKNIMSSIGTAITAGFTISSVLISNNIFGYLSVNSEPATQNWVVRNNTFTDSNPITLYNSVFENNFLAVSKNVSFSNVTYSYNVSVGATFPNELSGNRNNYPLSPLNESGQPESELVGTGSPDEVYQIKATSNLKTYGSSNSEVGAYGGSTPYIVSGIPPIPSIVNMTNSGSGDNSNPLKVTISVKSNN